MEIINALKTRRTARKFKQAPIAEEKILTMIDCARLSPSGANLQSLKYAVIADEEKRKELFPYIAYAGYIPDWNPSFEESPVAFIGVFNDHDIRPHNNATECDAGIAMMSITLAAHDMGIDSCMLGAIKREEIKKVLGIGDEYELLYMIALGESDRGNMAYNSSDEIKYSMDEAGNFQVPKRPLDDVIVKIK